MPQVREPTWLEALLLVLGAFRLTRLVGWDDLTVKFRRWVTGLTDRHYNMWADRIHDMQQEDVDPWSVDPILLRRHNAPEVPPVSERRFYFAKLMRCPWCLGFWISLLVVVGWIVDSGVTLLALSPFALSGAVGLLTKHLDP